MTYTINSSLTLDIFRNSSKLLSETSSVSQVSKEEVTTTMIIVPDATSGLTVHDSSLIDSVQILLAVCDVPLSYALSYNSSGSALQGSIESTVLFVYDTDITGLSVSNSSGSIGHLRLTVAGE